MACLSENQVVEFFSPDRQPEVVALIDAHTAGCERCRLLLAEYAQLGADTSATHVDPRPAALPSLTPTVAEVDERIERVRRLAEAQAHKHVGKVLSGKWEIEELIGTGGMAHVFAARHRNGRRVAIKCMRAELMLDRSLVERFLREGYVANKLEHPGAVAILDDDVMDDGTPFLVMELLVGRTLRQRLASGPLPLTDALRATAQVLDLLAVAHDKGIVHRDLKPDNLFETESGTIKVLDFGIARLRERTRPEHETRSGFTMGTVGYMPPEQARGLTAQVDARSDVWAIGATLYSLLTNRRLHEASTVNESLLLAMTSAVPPMRTLLPSAPQAVQDLLDTALAFDKEQRYPNARAMKQALESVMLGVQDTVLLSSPPAPALTPRAVSAVNAPVSTAVPPRRRRGLVALGFGAGAAALLFLGSRWLELPSSTRALDAVPSSSAAQIASAPAGTQIESEPAPPSTASTTTTNEADREEAPPASASTPAATASPTPAPRPKPPARAVTPPAPARRPAPAPVDTRDPLGPQH